MAAMNGQAFAEVSFERVMILALPRRRGRTSHQRRPDRARCSCPWVRLGLGFEARKDREVLRGRRRGVGGEDAIYAVAPWP